MANTIFAGRITGSPLSGLCERICIEAKQIYDGCILRLLNQSFDNIPLSNVQPNGFISPLNFVQASSNGAVQINNLVVSPIEDNRIRVRYDAYLPLSVAFTDASSSFMADSYIVIPRDLILRTPRDGAAYSIEAIASVLGRRGSVNQSASEASFTGCLAIITRVVTVADIVLPIYGKCVYPTCNEYDDGACRQLFNTPPFNL